VIAAAYFNRIALERRLSLSAIARGTNPDNALSQNTVNGLTKDGIPLPLSAPRRLLPAELEKNAKVISFCALSEEDYPHAIIYQHWDDIPPVSEDYKRARDSILKKLNALMNRLESE
jgi:hypothetical protein